MARRMSASRSAMAAARSAIANEPSPVRVTVANGKPSVHRASADLTDAEIDAAAARGEELRKIQPRAASARYDLKLRHVVVKYTNGATFSFPPALVQGLSGASADELADVRILGRGFGLHWEALDADLTVPGLVDYVFGARKVAARLAGQVKSPAKSKAARANGAKGGRPRTPKS
jgi:hypothetical protein